LHRFQQRLVKRIQRPRLGLELAKQVHFPVQIPATGWVSACKAAGKFSFCPGSGRPSADLGKKAA
jgi:hypothetical protein